MHGRIYHILLLILSLSAPLATPAGALEVTSVAPAEATPGSVVTVTGSALDEDVRVLLGPSRITPDAIRGDRLLFTVPPLPEGEYALSLRSGEIVSPQIFRFRVVTPAPRITSVSPSNVDICSASAGLEIAVRGRYFQPGASLLLNGKTIGYQRASEEVLTFTPPVLEAGVYGVQVINPDGRSSLPHSLYFNNIPEIQAVSMGENFVNSYQLIIEGKNFFFNSTLVVTTYPGDFSGLPPNQRVIVGRTSSGGQEQQLPGRTQSDILRYVDCNTLIYKRFPYSEQDKELSLQVINPDGKSSSTYYITAP